MDMMKKKRNSIDNVKLIYTGIKNRNNLDIIASTLYNVKHYNILEIYEDNYYYSDTIGIPKIIIYDDKIYKTISKKKNRKEKRLKRVGRL